MTTWAVAAKEALAVGTQLDFRLVGDREEWPTLAAGDLLRIDLPNDIKMLGTVVIGSVGTAEIIVAGDRYHISPATKSDGPIVPEDRAALWIIRNS